MTPLPPHQVIGETYRLSSFTISPFGRHSLLRTKDRRLFLLKPVARQSDDINTLFGAMAYLKDKGFLSALPWYTIDDALSLIIWENRYWALIPWIYGRPAPAFSDSGIAIFLRLFHRLHQIGDHCPHGPSFFPSREFQLRLKDLENGFDTVKDRSWAATYRNALPDSIPIAQNALRMINASPDRVTLCHGDPSAANTRLRPDGQWVLVDWDRLVRAPRWWELAQITRRFGSFQGWRPEVMKRFILQFQREISLTSGELTAFYGALLFPQELWRLGYQYFIEQRRPEGWYKKRLAAILQSDQRRYLTLLQWHYGLFGKEER